MRILHAALAPAPMPSVLRQMEMEQAAGSLEGLEWSTRVFAAAGAFSRNPIVVESAVPTIGSSAAGSRGRDWIQLRRDFYKWLSSCEQDFDVILLRYVLHDPLLLKYLRGSSVPVCLVHHTMEPAELGSGHKADVRRLAESVIAPGVIRASAATIGVTQEIVDFEVRRARRPRRPATVYPNGIGPDVVPIADSRGSTPTFLFMSSSFPAWQGLDLLLDSIEHSSLEFVVHVVGHVPQLQRCRAEQLEQVQLHDWLEPDEYRSIASECWVGLSSLALSRAGLTQACPLKVREYLAMGLPVAGNYTEVLPRELPYFRGIRPDVESLLRFAETSRAWLRQDVANGARPFIQKAALVRTLSSWLEANIA